MLGNVLALVLVACSGQQPARGPEVGRVVVHTPASSSIVFEYVHRYIPADEPVGENALEELRSELLATGLFTDLKVEVRPAETGKVDVHVFPAWQPRPEGFLVGEIVFEGFAGMHDRKVKSALKGLGLKPGSALFEFPPNEVRRLLDQAIERVYRDDLKSALDYQTMAGGSTILIKPLAATQFRLVVRAAP